jgi:hypothetical protein
MGTFPGASVASRNLPANNNGHCAVRTERFNTGRKILTRRNLAWRPFGWESEVTRLPAMLQEMTSPTEEMFAVVHLVVSMSVVVCSQTVQ